MYWIVTSLVYIHLSCAFNSQSTTVFRRTKLFEHDLEEYPDSSDSKIIGIISIKQQRRKMQLRWCDRENCNSDNLLRERVVGDQNQIMVRFEGS